MAGQTPWSSLVQGLEPFLISGQWVASAAGSNWPDSSGFVAGVKAAQLGSMRKEGLECRGGGASEGEVTRSGVREKRQVSIPNANGGGIQVSIPNANGGGIQVSIPNANGGFLEQRNRPEAGKGQQAAQGTKDEHFGSDPPGCMRNEWPGLEGWHTEAGHLGSAPSGRMRKEGPGSLGWRAKGEGKVQCGPRTSEAGGEAEKEAGKVGGDSGRTSEAGGQAENRTGGAGSKRSRGKAAGKTKNRGSFTIQLSNITNWSAKAKSWVGAQQSDVQIIGEHHLLPGELDSGCSFLKMRDWRCFASPAERSEGGEGTSGGTLVAARMHLDARPVASATPTSSGWRCKPETPYAAATQITLGHRQVLILGGYCRGGIESREAGEVMRAWQDLTSGGDTLYIAGADFNVHPSVLRNSRFLESLKGVIISSGLSTCTGAAGEGNELDYFIVHRDLAPNVLRCTRHWGVPFAPHATVLLEMCFQQNLMTKLAFRLPKMLPDGQLASLDEDGWGQCRSEAEESVGRKRLEADTVGQLLCPRGGEEAAKEEDKRSGLVAKATDLSKDYEVWCNALERAVLREAKVPRSQWGPYLGRGAHPALIVVNIGQNREGPIAAIKVEANQSAAGRLLATWTILVNNIGRRPEVHVWKTTLMKLLISHEEEAKKLVALVGYETHARLVSALRKVAAGSASELEFASVVGRLRAVEKVVKRKGAEERSAAQDEWRREALSGGARGAHAFANSPNKPKQVDQCTLLRECLPAALAREQTEVWGSKWHCSEVEEVIEYRRHMEELRQWALDQRSLDPEAFARERASWQELLTPPKLVAAAASFKARTGIGTDNVHFRLIKQAPPLVLLDLCGLFARVLEDLIWPDDQTFTLLHLIPKKMGYRTVGTLTTFVRLLMRLLGQNFRRWDEASAFAFDSAAPGQRADDHVFVRQASLEAWVARGRQTGQILWDIASFYEEIRPGDLVQDVKNTNFPATEAALSMLNHGGKRILAVEGAFGSILEGVGRSIVTGCTSSTSLARAFMARPLANLVKVQASIKEESGADMQCSIHVDDLATFGSASSEGTLLEALMQVSSVFIEEMVGRQMSISSKTVVLMPRRSLGTKIQRFLQRRFGITVLVEQTGAALGIEVSANHSVRRAGLVKARFAKARRRANRGGWLVAKDKRAAKLFTTGAAPMAEYGAATNGLSPGYLDKLDNMAARAAGANGFSPCPISLTMFHLGFVPSVRAIGKQVSAWIRNWNKADAETKSSWSEGWQKIRDVLTRAPAAERWMKVTSPISATIATLLHIGWAPIQAGHWLARDRKNQAVIGRGSWEDSQIVKAIEEDAELQAWKRASTNSFAANELGQGPPCWEGVRRAAKKLKKLGLDDSVQGLHKVAVGGGCFGERIFLRQSCDRCGADMETPEHRYYDCPANASIVGEEELRWLQKSQWLVEKAKSRAAPDRLLWCRGVLPFNRSGRLAFEGPEEEAKLPFQWAVGSKLPASQQGKEGCSLYTDGSGGGVTPLPCLRRAGSGAVWFGQTSEGRADMSPVGWSKIGAVAAAVPGRQTVPRAEVWAGVAAAEIEAAGRGRKMHSWVVDARYVQTGVASLVLAPGHQKSSLGKDFGARVNNDLWQEVETSVQSGCLPLATWMKSHQTLEEVARGSLAIEDYMGNALADALAGVAAEVAQVPELVLREAEEQVTLAFFICMRIAIVEAAVKKFKEENELSYIVKGKVNQLSKARAAKEAEWKLEDSGHSVTGHGPKSLRCSGCGNIRPLGDLRWWFANSCSGMGQVLEQEPETPDEGGLETFVGKLPDFLAFKKRRKVEDVGTTSRNKRRREVAFGCLVKAKAKEVSPESWQGGMQAGVQPVWVWKLHLSHNLYHGGGGAFCATCGAANGRSRKGKLHDPCKGRLSAGSAWRLQGLMAGRNTAWKGCWPDGRCGKIRIEMKKVVRDADRLVSDLRAAEGLEGEGGEIRG